MKNFKRSLCKVCFIREKPDRYPKKDTGLVFIYGRGRRQGEKFSSLEGAFVYKKPDR